MDDASIQVIVDELAPLLTGRAPGKVFQFDLYSLAIDFGLRHQGYLFISVEPANPRLYLIKRRVRDLEKQSRALTQFPLTLRKEMSGTRLISLAKDPDDRIVRFVFTGEDELGNTRARTLVAQLTGRSANLLLLDSNEMVLQRLRASEVGQQTGERYQQPKTAARTSPTKSSALLAQIRSGNFSSPSEAADAYFASLFAERDSAARINAARAALSKRISQKQKLLNQLESDLRSHADAEGQKRLGDLLLANLSTAKRQGDRVTLVDYFADDASLVEMKIDESVSLQEEASRRFVSYQRSKRATAQIVSRIAQVKSEIQSLAAERQRLVSEPGAVAMGSGRTLAENASSARAPTPKRIPGTRRYISSDGFEILVGRTSKDNDHLTFKVAKPNDMWLHAADYGGSHVVVRNSTRKEIPHQTLIEAAQLAAYFSQAKRDPKVDVHYTERKFVTKPKGAKPGLVRLQRCKNITVAPKEAGVRE